MAVQIAKALDAHVVAATTCDDAAWMCASTARTWCSTIDSPTAASPCPPLDVVFDLAQGASVDLTVISQLLSAGGVLVSAAAPLPTDMHTDVRAVRLASHPDADQLAQLVALVDAGKLRLNIGDVR